jgi:hypothetical protein
MMARLESTAGAAAFMREANVDAPLRRTIERGLQTLPLIRLKTHPEIRRHGLARVRAAGATCGREPPSMRPSLMASSGKRTRTTERGIERFGYDGPPLAAGVLERGVLRSSS